MSKLHIDDLYDLVAKLRLKATEEELTAEEILDEMVAELDILDRDALS